MGTDQTKRITADLDRPLPSLGSGTAFRLNLMGHDSKFAGRDIAENRRYGVAPSLAFGLGSPTRLTLSYLREGSDDTPDYGIPWLFNGPAPVERRNYYGFEHGNYLKTNVDMGTVKFEHDVNSHITFRNQARYAHYHRDVRITEAQIDATTLDADPLATPLGQIGVIRNQIAVNSTETFLQDQADVIMKFNTGSLRHTVVTGVGGRPRNFIAVPSALQSRHGPKNQPVASRYQPALCRHRADRLASPIRTLPRSARARTRSIPSTCCPSSTLSEEFA